MELLFVIRNTCFQFAYFYYGVFTCIQGYGQTITLLLSHNILMKGLGCERNNIKEISKPQHTHEGLGCERNTISKPQHTNERAG